MVQTAQPDFGIQLVASVEAVFFILPLPSESGRLGRGQLWLLRGRKNLELPHFNRIPMHVFFPPPTSDPFSALSKNL
jgi:hypothetical protein